MQVNEYRNRCYEERLLGESNAPHRDGAHPAREHVIVSVALQLLAPGSRRASGSFEFSAIHLYIRS